MHGGVVRAVMACGILGLLSGCGDEIVRSGCADGGQEVLPGDFTVVNAATCENRAIVTDPGVFAVRVTPPRWPARVDRVRFVLQGSAIGITCDHTIPFDVLLFKGTDDRPPADPMILSRVELTGDPGGAESQTLTYAPDEPVALGTSENLFVGFALPTWVPGEPRQCLGFCGEDGVGDWNSGTTTPPFAWSENRLEGLGLRQIVEADGETL